MMTSIRSGLVSTARLVAVLALLAEARCSAGSNGQDQRTLDGGTPSADGRDAAATHGAADGDATPDAGGTVGASTDAASSDAAPTGWLYTKGNHIYLSDGKSGTVWMGRGVDMDDLYLCGANPNLTNTSAEQDLKAIVDAMMTLKPNFVRTSLYLDSFPAISSWTSGSPYATQMTSVIDYIGQAYPGVYVLITLRTDTSMDCPNLPGNDATCLPTSSTNAVYKALVDSFAQSNFVLFSLSNEPGGFDGFTPLQISSAMSEAVSTIRTEEDALKVPHHIISVQGSASTSNLTYYLTTPIQADNIVYELHFYPDANTGPSNYAYASALPAIVGEYGNFNDAYESQTLFYTDMEAMQIPNLAFDYEPFSNCAPDLVNIGAADAGPTAWGQTVMAYLAAH